MMGKIWKIALSAEKLELLLRYYSQHPLGDTPKFRISKSQKKALKRMQEALAGNLHGCDFENVDSF
jgi:DNA-directed RNA polymerase subunit L